MRNPSFEFIPPEELFTMRPASFLLQAPTAVVPSIDASSANIPKVPTLVVDSLKSTAQVSPTPDSVFTPTTDTASVLAALDEGSVSLDSSLSDQVKGETVPSIAVNNPFWQNNKGVIAGFIVIGLLTFYFYKRKQRKIRKQNRAL